MQVAKNDFSVTAKPVWFCIDLEALACLGFSTQLAELHRCAVQIFEKEGAGGSCGFSPLFSHCFQFIFNLLFLDEACCWEGRGMVSLPTYGSQFPFSHLAQSSAVWFVLLTEAVSFDSGICLQLIFDSPRMFLLHKEKVEIVVLNCAQPLTECLLTMINDCIRLS